MFSCCVFDCRQMCGSMRGFQLQALVAALDKIKMTQSATKLAQDCSAPVGKNAFTQSYCHRRHQGMHRQHQNFANRLTSLCDSEEPKSVAMLAQISA